MLYRWSLVHVRYLDSDYACGVYSIRYALLCHGYHFCADWLRYVHWSDSFYHLPELPVHGPFIPFHLRAFYGPFSLLPDDEGKGNQVRRPRPRNRGYLCRLKHFKTGKMGVDSV